MMQMLALPWAIPVVFGCLVAIVAILANVTSGTIKAMSETSLKKRMVDQGFPAAEIERVLRASSHHCPHCGHEYDDDDEKPFKPPKRHAGVA